MRLILLKPVLTLALLCACGPAFAQSEPDPVTSDPTLLDPDFPPSMEEISFESHGLRLNGLIYIANGLGPHPTVLLLHGFPGNERNLDLAQAMRRAGMNVVFFDYRGTWGSGGGFSLHHALDDVARVVDVVRDSAWAAAYRSDPGSVGLVGHSFGAFFGAMTTAGDDRIACLAFLDGTNMGAMGRRLRDNPGQRAGVIEFFETHYYGEGGPVSGGAAELIQEAIDHAEEYDVLGRASDLAGHPLFIASASRGNGPNHDALVSALSTAGADRLVEHLYDDDHGFSAHRIDLARRLVSWQMAECW